MNETLELRLWESPYNKEKIEEYINATKNNIRVIVGDYVCIVTLYEFNAGCTPPGFSEWTFEFLIVDYVKDSK